MYPDTYQNKEDDSSVWWFSSPFDALNNWSAHVVKAYGREFHTLEHAYHYQKFVGNNQKVAEEICNAPSPWVAMQIARREQKNVRHDWEDCKLEIMEDLVKLKLAQNKDVQMILDRTAGRVIIENSPWDDFWGVGSDGNGQNMMGKIWMKVRDGK